MKKSIFWVAAVLFFAAGFLSSCGDDDKDKETIISVKSVALSHSTLALPISEDAENPSTAVLTYTLEPVRATNIKSVRWSSNAEGIATVSLTGLVTSLEIGEATITVTVEVTDGSTFTDRCTVNVVPAPIPVVGVEFEDEGQALAPGTSVALTAIVYPEDASVKTLIWESNKDNVATVDQQGVVTAVDIGTAIITVTTVDGEHKARYEINVKYSVTSVKIEGVTKQLEVGDELEWTAVVLPANATYPGVIWESSAPSVVTVNDEGLVKAMSPGTATITLSSEDGELTDTRDLVVVGTAVTGVTLGGDMTIEKVYENVDQERNLSVTILPENATNKNVSWNSSDPDLVAIDENGKVTIKGSGSVTITVTTDDGEFTDNIVFKIDGYYTWIDRSKWSILGYNEGLADNRDGGPGWSSQAPYDGGARITAILTDNDDEFWHASWSSPSTDYPHWFIVSLGEEVEFEGVMLRRRTGNGGTSTGYQIYTANNSDPLSLFDWVDRGEYDFNPGTNDRQVKALDAGTVKARYIYMYFDEKYRGSSNYAMFSQFGLYKRE